MMSKKDIQKKHRHALLLIGRVPVCLILDDA